MDTLDSVLKIVIVHEDLNTGIGAATVLGRLTALLETEFQIESDAWRMDSNIWKFEMLREPELGKQAAAEAVAADMIIISVCEDELPAYVRDWIEGVLPMKEGRPAALVALLDWESDASGQSPRPEAYLRRLAGRNGLDFFCNTDDQSRHIASGIESIVSRREGISPIGGSSSPGLLPAGMGRK
jgi:hypothetical protein